MIIERSDVNTVALGVTITPVYLVNKAGEQLGGAKMLEYSEHYMYFLGLKCEAIIRRMHACILQV